MNVVSLTDELTNTSSQGDNNKTNFYLIIENINNNNILQIKVNEEDNIKNLKEKIHEEAKIDIKTQRLLAHDGMLLKNDNTISEYEISKNKKIYLSVIPAEFICSRSGEIMKDPVMYNNEMCDGDYLVSNIFNSVEKEKISHDEAIRNPQLKLEIDKWLQQEKRKCTNVNILHCHHEPKISQDDFIDFNEMLRNKKKIQFEKKLEKLGLSQWKSVFIVNGFEDESALQYITEEYLIEWEISATERQAILKSINVLKASNTLNLDENKKIMNVALFGSSDSDKWDVLQFGMSKPPMDYKRLAHGIHKNVFLLKKKFNQMDVRVIDTQAVKNLSKSDLLPNIDCVILVSNSQTYSLVIDQWLKIVKDFYKSKIEIAIVLLVDDIDYVPEHVNENYKPYIVSTLQSSSIKNAFEDILFLSYQAKINANKSNSNHDNKSKGFWGFLTYE